MFAKKTANMHTDVTYILLALGIFALFLIRKTSYFRVILLLEALGLIYTSRYGFESQDTTGVILGLLGGIMTIGIAARFVLPRIAQWIALAGTFVFLAAAGNTAVYLGFDLHFSGILLFLPFLGATGPLLIDLNARGLEKILGLPADGTIRFGNTAYLALMAFFATFQAGFFGVLLIASGWLAVALSTEKFKAVAGGIALLTLAFAFLVVKLQQPEIESSWMRGNWLMGLIAGAGAMSWVGHAVQLKRFRFLLMYIFPLLILFAFILMGKANETFGGVPAYLGALIGAALVLLTASREEEPLAFQGLLLGIAGFVLVAFAPVKMPEKTSRLKPAETAQSVSGKKKEPDVMDIPAVSLSEAMSGKWKSITEASRLDFRLGPEGGVTKGGITEFDVRLGMNQEGHPKSLDVTIPVAKLTTFNAMRDESVLGAGYLNEAKYPKMRFASESFVQEGDRFLVEGHFEMLGKKAKQLLEVKFAASGADDGKEYLVMVGKAVLDRTQFGMKSDPKIGDEVSVSFEVEFRR